MGRFGKNEPFNKAITTTCAVPPLQSALVPQPVPAGAKTEKVTSLLLMTAGLTVTITSLVLLAASRTVIVTVVSIATLLGMAKNVAPLTALSMGNTRLL